MHTLAEVPVGGFFVSALGNTCQRVAEGQITRLFNQTGQPAIWTRPASSSEVISTVLPPGINF